MRHLGCYDFHRLLGFGHDMDSIFKRNRFICNVTTVGLVHRHTISWIYSAGSCLYENRIGFITEQIYIAVLQSRIGCCLLKIRRHAGSTGSPDGEMLVIRYWFLMVGTSFSAQWTSHTFPSMLSMSCCGGAASTITPDRMLTPEQTYSVQSFPEWVDGPRCGGRHEGECRKLAKLPCIAKRMRPWQYHVFNSIPCNSSNFSV